MIEINNFDCCSTSMTNQHCSQCCGIQSSNHCDQCINCCHCEGCVRCEDCFNCFNCFDIVNGTGISNYSIHTSGAYGYIISTFSKRFILNLHAMYGGKHTSSFSKIIGFLVCSRPAVNMLLRSGCPINIFPREILANL